MRELIVVSKDVLPEDVLGTLGDNQWSIHYARDIETGEDPVIAKHLLVGLILFPESRDTRLEAHLQRQVVALPQIKWVAALTPQQLSQRDIKQFIADHLYDFHIYPLDGERLSTVLGHAYGLARLEHELGHHDMLDVPTRLGLVGESAAMHRLFRMLQRAAGSNVSVLITGPTGTGKELAARAIHDHSERAQGPYVAINCAAIPPSLLQSELFGHEKGSFTSATTRKMGYIQSAAGGTLFLDEIGDMPMESQATLLRFLEDKIVTPIGSTRGKPVDVRILASTNVDLEEAIQKKRFRADLYYRLAFLTIETPALRERGDDIGLLAQHFLDDVMRSPGVRQLKLSKAAIDVLKRHEWPGNVRELRSVIFQAALSCDGLTIQPRDLKIQGGAPMPSTTTREETHREPAERVNGSSYAPISTLKSAREQSEKSNLEHALERNACNITRTAQDLGVSRMTLYRLMAKHGVERSAIESDK